MVDPAPGDLISYLRRDPAEVDEIYQLLAHLMRRKAKRCRPRMEPD